MRNKLISMVKMTSSSVRSSTAIRHFLPRLGKTPCQKVIVFKIANWGFIPQDQTLAALQFALPRDFKYLITSDDDFLLKMDLISEIDDTWFHLGILNLFKRAMSKVDGHDSKIMMDP